MGAHVMMNCYSEYKYILDNTGARRLNRFCWNKILNTLDSVIWAYP